jgi:hypothetical protein
MALFGSMVIRSDSTMSKLPDFSFSISSNCNPYIIHEGDFHAIPPPSYRTQRRICKTEKAA